MKSLQSIYKLTLETELEITKVYIEALRKSTDEETVKIANSLAKEVTRIQTNAIKESIKIGAQDNIRELHEIIQRINLEDKVDIQAVYRQIHLDVIRPFFYSDIYKDGKTLTDRVWEYTEEFEQQINYILAQAVAEGKSAISLAKDLEYFVKEPSKRPVEISDVYPNIKGRIDYNALRLARTTINHAYQMAAVKSAAKHPNTKGVRWLTSNNHEKVCDLCRERAETDQYGLGVGVFPVDEVPLDHPNGMCTLVQEPIKELDELVDDLLRWIEGEENEEFTLWYDSLL